MLSCLPQHGVVILQSAGFSGASTAALEARTQRDHGQRPNANPLATGAREPRRAADRLRQRRAAQRHRPQRRSADAAERARSGQRRARQAARAAAAHRGRLRQLPQAHQARDRRRAPARQGRPDPRICCRCSTTSSARCRPRDGAQRRAARSLDGVRMVLKLFEDTAERIGLDARPDRRPALRSRGARGHPAAGDRRASARHGRRRDRARLSLRRAPGAAGDGRRGAQARRSPSRRARAAATGRSADDSGEAPDSNAGDADKTE